MWQEYDEIEMTFSLGNLSGLYLIVNWAAKILVTDWLAPKGEIRRKNETKHSFCVFMKTITVKVLLFENVEK